MQLGDMEKEEGGRLVKTQDCGRVRAVSTVRLVSARTLRTTLCMSKSESEWRLMHSTLRPASGMRPLSLPLTIPALSLAPTLPMHSPRPTSRKSSLPSDRDFTRIQTRLSKLSSGVSLSLRPAVLSEDKSVELLLEQEERTYLRVSLSHRRIPLEVSLRYVKGLCVVYVSRTVAEPSESLHDECHRKDTFSVSETGLRFKSEWLYIGLKCLKDAKVILSIRFGANRSSNSHKGPLVLTDGLETFRKDEIKRQVLDKEVATILQRRKEEFGARFSLQNFISKNKSAAGRFRAISKPIWDEDHRRAVLERRQVYREKRVESALLSLKRPEMLLERKRKAEEILREKHLRTNREKHWVTGIASAKAISELWTRFELRKISIIDLKRRVKAAIRLQICFKRCIFALDPRQLTLRRAQTALTLFISSTALTVKGQKGDFLGSLLRASWQSQLVKAEFDRFLRKGNEQFSGTDTGKLEGLQGGEGRVEGANGRAVGGGGAAGSEGKEAEEGGNRDSGHKGERCGDREVLGGGQTAVCRGVGEIPSRPCRALPQVAFLPPTALPVRTPSPPPPLPVLCLILSHII